MQVWLLFQQGMTLQHFSTVSWSLYLLIKHTCEAKSHRTADGRHPFCRSSLASLSLPTCLHQSQSLASLSLVGLAFGVLRLAVSMILLATLLQPPVMTHSTVPPHHVWKVLKTGLMKEPKYLKTKPEPQCTNCSYCNSEKTRI